MMLFILVFPVSLDEIKRFSRENPEKAYTLLMEYIKKHPGDEKALKLGRVISAKRSLCKIREICPVVLSEDASTLINELATFSSIDKKTVGLIEVVFPDFYDVLRRRVMEFSNEAFKVCEILPERVKEPEGLEKKVVDEYFKAPLSFDPERIEKLKCMNLERLKAKIRKYLGENFEEKNYLAILRISEMLGIEPPHATDLRAYAELNEKLSTLELVSLTESDFQSMVKVYESINLEKVNLANKLRQLYMKLSQRMDLSFCKDKEICPEIKKVSKVAPGTQGEEKRATSAATINLQRGFENPITTIIVVLFVILITALIVLTVIKLNDPRRRISRIKKKLEKNPADPQLHLRLASLYEQIGRVEEAMGEYRLAYKLFNYEKKSSGSNQN